MLEIKAYLCEHGCKKILKTKQGMKSHEARCWLNPEKRACLSCRHKVITQENVSDPYHGGAPGSSDSEIDIDWCEAERRALFDPEEGWSLKHDCRHWKKKDCN